MYVVWVPYFYPTVYQWPGAHLIYPTIPSYVPYRPYPDVDPELFIKSASSMKGLMNEAQTVVKKIENSKEFANEVMRAAQESDQSKVDSLIRSTGITAPFHAEYNPDRLKLNMSASVEQLECCQLTIVLRWRR